MIAALALTAWISAAPSPADWYPFTATGTPAPGEAAVTGGAGRAVDDGDAGDGAGSDTRMDAGGAASRRGRFRKETTANNVTRVAATGSHTKRDRRPVDADSVSGPGPSSQT